MAEFHSMPNRRGEDRKQVLFKTAIKVGSISTQCEIRDIGPGGVRIGAALQAAPPASPGCGAVSSASSSTNRRNASTWRSS
jgi:hypothetical protein